MKKFILSLCILILSLVTSFIIYSQLTSNRSSEYRFQDGISPEAFETFLKTYQDSENNPKHTEMIADITYTFWEHTGWVTVDISKSPEQLKTDFLNAVETNTQELRNSLQESWVSQQIENDFQQEQLKIIQIEIQDLR